MYDNTGDGSVKLNLVIGYLIGANYLGKETNVAQDLFPKTVPFLWRETTSKLSKEKRNI